MHFDSYYLSTGEIQCFTGIHFYCPNSTTQMIAVMATGWVNLNFKQIFNARKELLQIVDNSFLKVGKNY